MAKKKRKVVTFRPWLNLIVAMEDVFLDRLLVLSVIPLSKL